MGLTLLTRRVICGAASLLAWVEAIWYSLLAFVLVAGDHPPFQTPAEAASYHEALHQREQAIFPCFVLAWLFFAAMGQWRKNLHEERQREAKR